MDEPTPERVFRVKKNVVDPDSDAPVPFHPPMGMPMSPLHGMQGQQIPAEPVQHAYVPDAADPFVGGAVVPGEPMYHAATLPALLPTEHVPMTPMSAAEPMGAYVLPAAEPRHLESLALPGEPAHHAAAAPLLGHAPARTLPAHEPFRGEPPVEPHCCACCGNHHGGKESDKLTENPPGDTVGVPDGKCGTAEGEVTEPEPMPPSAGENVPAPGESVPPGTVTDPVSTEEPCACCGKVHPGSEPRSSVPGEPLTPLTPATSLPKATTLPATEPMTPGTPPLAGQESQKPLASRIPATPGGKGTPAKERRVGEALPKQKTPARTSSPPTTVAALTPPPTSTPPPEPKQPAGQGGNPLSFASSNNPATNNNPTNGGGNPGAGPKSGKTSPDKNIRFDEASYTRLIAEMDTLERSLKMDATSTDLVDLDAELALQPSGQTWEPALNLYTRGQKFGGSVETENDKLRTTISTFHTALESAKAVFKETDDLAAYDSTVFISEYPDFNSGGGAIA